MEGALALPRGFMAVHSTDAPFEVLADGITDVVSLWLRDDAELGMLVAGARSSRPCISLQLMRGMPRRLVTP